MAFVVGNLVAALELDTKGFARALDVAKGRGDKFVRNWSRNTRRLGGELRGLGQSFGRYVTLPLVGLGALSAKTAIDFETSFAGIRKTVTATEQEFAELEAGIRKLATTKLPINVNELNRIGEAGGQFNIAKEAMLDFIEAIAIGKVAIPQIETTNLAETLAQIKVATGGADSEIRNMVNTLADLGNNSETTEAQILDMTQRIAGTGNEIGIATAKLFGIAAALSSVGVDAERGGTAISKTMLGLLKAVEQGTGSLVVFAKTAGLSVGDFRELFERDAAEAVIRFVEGLGRVKKEGGDLTVVLDQLGISGDRQVQSLLLMANAGGKLREQMDRGTRAWQDNIAAVAEAAKRFETSASKIQLALNKIIDAGIEFGGDLVPTLVDVAETAGSLAKAFGALSPSTRKLIISASLVAAALAPVLIAVASILRILGTFAPIVITASAALGTLWGAMTPAATSVGVAFSALTGLTTALVAGSAALGGIIGLISRPFLNKWLSLGEAFGLVSNQASDLSDGMLKAEGPIQRFAASLNRLFTGDDWAKQSEAAFHRAVDGLTLLKTQLNLTGKEWEFNTEQTRANAERIEHLTQIALRLAALKKQERDAVLNATAAHVASGGAVDDVIFQTEEQRKAVEGMVKGLEDELARLKLNNTEYLKRNLLLENATAQQIKEALALQRSIDAEEARKAAAEEADLAERTRLDGIQATIQSLEDRAAATIHDADTITLGRLAQERATAADLDRARSLIDQIRAQRDRAAAEVEAQRIIERSMTKFQQKTLEIQAVLTNSILTDQQKAAAIREIEAAYDEVGQAMDRFAIRAADVAVAAQRAFSDFFFDPFEEGVKGMVQQFAEALRRMVADYLASLVVGAIFGLPAGRRGGQAASLPTTSPVPLPEFATGGATSGVKVQVPKAPDGVFSGLVKGFGTPTSDNQLIRVSPREYVIKAAAVQKFGLQTFESLNNLRMPEVRGFASGGMVGGGIGSTVDNSTNRAAVNNYYTIDARGAERGVEQRIVQALRLSEDRAVRRSVDTILDGRKRGGSMAAPFRRG